MTGAQKRKQRLRVAFARVDAAVTEARDQFELACEAAHEMEVMNENMNDEGGLFGAKLADVREGLYGVYKGLDPEFCSIDKVLHYGPEPTRNWRKKCQQLE